MNNRMDIEDAKDLPATLEDALAEVRKLRLQVQAMGALMESPQMYANPEAVRQALIEASHVLIYGHTDFLLPPPAKLRLVCFA